MDFAQWLSLVSICLLGAMSPGPSLAVIINAALRGGRGHGILAGVTHGIGVGLYGLLTVTGLAVLITRSPTLFLGLQLAGAAYLLYLGIKSLQSTGAGEAQAEADSNASAGSAALSGFLVAFLNPKLAIFMLALFAQFLRPEAGIAEKLLMALTVGLTDATWYVLMAAMVSHPAIYQRLRERSALIDRVFGVLLLLLALSVFYRALSGP